MWLYHIGVLSLGIYQQCWMPSTSFIIPINFFHQPTTTANSWLPAWILQLYFNLSILQWGHTHTTSFWNFNWVFILNGIEVALHVCSYCWHSPHFLEPHNTLPCVLIIRKQQLFQNCTKWWLIFHLKLSFKAHKQQSDFTVLVFTERITHACMHAPTTGCMYLLFELDGNIQTNKINLPIKTDRCSAQSSKLNNKWKG